MSCRPEAVDHCRVSRCRPWGFANLSSKCMPDTRMRWAWVELARQRLFNQVGSRRVMGVSVPKVETSFIDKTLFLQRRDEHLSESHDRYRSALTLMGHLAELKVSSCVLPGSEENNPESTSKRSALEPRKRSPGLTAGSKSRTVKT